MTTTLNSVPARRSDFYSHVGDANMDVVPLSAPSSVAPPIPIPIPSSDVFLCEALMTFFAAILFLITLPFSLLICLKTIKEYQRAIVLRWGRLRVREVRGPGLIFVLRCTDEVRVVDLRTITAHIPPQTALTRDSVTATVDSVIYYNVYDPISCCVNVKNCSESTKVLAMTTLRNVLGTRTLSELMTDREAISRTVRQLVEDGADAWGVKIDRVEITDVKLPDQLQRVMAAEAEAVRESRAKVIAADGELRASKTLKDAADVLTENSVSLQLRYLQTLNSIASNRTATIIFPVPSEMFKKSYCQ